MNLKIARMKAGYTQKQIAETLDTTISTVSRWENGDPVPADKLKKLSKLLGVTTDYILELEEV